MLTASLEKVSLMSYNIESEDVSDEKLFFYSFRKMNALFYFPQFLHGLFLCLKMFKQPELLNATTKHAKIYTCMLIVWYTCSLN